MTRISGNANDPSHNTDIISSAFWLVSGTEFKITCSHCPSENHKSLSSWTKTCRSKITNYSDFRNGKVLSRDQCLGRCSVYYGGQYQLTEGFKQAACNGEMQDANSIGFWCHCWGAGGGPVIMIGGGGSSCRRADHRIGVTEANSPSLANLERKDFGSETFDNLCKRYSLNLWVK